MKRDIMDRLVGFFSPEAEVRRIKAKARREYFKRNYDAAETFRTDDWTSVTSTSSNKELQAAQSVLRDKARDAIRNNPYALHARDVIVSNTVGYGIVPNIKGVTDEHTKQLQEAWEFWGETTLCDAENRRNYYGLQAIALGSAVEAGESLGKKVLVKDPRDFVTSKGSKSITGAIKIQILESDFLDSKKDDEKNVQGIEVTPFGQRTGYWLYQLHPGNGKESESKKVSAEEVVHVFKADRPGQQRGVSWFHAVIRSLEDFKNYQEATLIRQKIAACFAAFITTDGSESPLSATETQARRQQDSAVEPGLIRYLGRDEGIVFASPPGVENYAEYCRQTLRGISAGLGITYEALTNDYSQVNFSSGRMGNLEQQRNIDMWRWNMLIPQFCEPTFKWFLEFCELQLGIKTEGVTVEWTPPARQMIDPGTEIRAIKDSIRIGIKTLPEAIREQGYDPETFFLEVQQTNQKMDELGLAFDSDARKMSAVGFAQAGDSFDKLLGKEPQGDKIEQENNEANPAEGSSEEPS